MAANGNNGIVLVPGRNEAAVKRGTRFWNLVGANGIRRGAVVPYEDPAKSLDGYDGIKDQVNRAIRTLNADSRLRVLFKKLSPSDPQWIRFETQTPWPYADCPAYVTKIGKHHVNVQRVFISDKATVGNVMHELMHVLGFKHEQQRFGSDNNVDIHPAVAANDNFVKDSVAVPPKASYDIESIMHYPECKSVTLTPAYVNWLKNDVYPGKAEKQIRDMVGQRQKLSEGDVKGVGWLYGSYGCTYSAFLDNPCEHKHLLCVTCAKRICLYCQETCGEHKGHKVKVVEDHDGGFVCCCLERDKHIATKFETHAHEYEKVAS